MPFLIPVFAAIGPALASLGGGSALAGALTLGSLATTGVTTGLEISNAVNQPGAPTLPATSTTPQAQTPAVSTSQRTAVANALPTLQSLTGGSVSPEYAAQWGGQQTGVSADPQGTGNIQAAINQFFGLGAPGQSGLSSSGPAQTGNSITDLLANVKIPGGTSPTGGSVVDSFLNQDFKGFS